MNTYRWQYQSKAEPVVVEMVPPLDSWFERSPDPIVLGKAPLNIGPDVTAPVFIPDQFVDRWWRQTSEPVRTKPEVRYLIPGYACPMLDIVVEVAPPMDSWYRQTVGPTPRKPGISPALLVNFGMNLDPIIEALPDLVPNAYMLPPGWYVVQPSVAVGYSVIYPLVPREIFVKLFAKDLFIDQEYFKDLRIDQEYFKDMKIC